MTIDANLIEGVKFGVAIGFVIGIIACVYPIWALYQKAWDEGFEEGKKVPRHE